MFNGDRIIVPHSLRPEILHRIHEGHFGIDKCRARARGACSVLAQYQWCN